MSIEDRVVSFENDGIETRFSLSSQSDLTLMQYDQSGTFLRGGNFWYGHERSILAILMQYAHQGKISCDLIRNNGETLVDWARDEDLFSPSEDIGEPRLVGHEFSSQVYFMSVPIIEDDPTSIALPHSIGGTYKQIAYTANQDLIFRAKTRFDKKAGKVSLLIRPQDVDPFARAFLRHVSQDYIYGSAASLLQVVGHRGWNGFKKYSEEIRKFLE